MIFNPVLMESPSPTNGRYCRDVFAVLDAGRLYEEACRKSRLTRLWSLLTRREHRLLDLATIEATCQVHDRYYRGMQTVLIKQIIGSEGRSADFDAQFYPCQSHSRERWIGVATAWNLGLNLSPIKLVGVEDRYFVVDGHHRVSVARALGQEYIEAEVTTWQVSGALPWAVQQTISKVPAPGVKRLFDRG